MFNVKATVIEVVSDVFQLGFNLLAVSFDRLEFFLWLGFMAEFQVVYFLR